jgi:hypothetical protein
MFYAAVELDAGASLTLSMDQAPYAERAVYVVDGAVKLNGTVLAPQHMGVLANGQPAIIASLESGSAARMMLLGGEPVDGDRFIWWNFVSSRKNAIDEAKQRWRRQEFGAVPDETEWIPLPDEPKPPEPMS